MSDVTVMSLLHREWMRLSELSLWVLHINDFLKSCFLKSCVSINVIYNPPTCVRNQTLKLLPVMLVWCAVFSVSPMFHYQYDQIMYIYLYSVYMTVVIIELCWCCGGFYLLNFKHDRKSNHWSIYASSGPSPVIHPLSHLYKHLNQQLNILSNFLFSQQ